MVATPDDAQAAAGGVAARPLGNYTKSWAGIEARDAQNPELIQWFRIDEKRREHVEVIDPKLAAWNARIGRFSAQSSAAKLFHADTTPRGGQWRVTGCHRRRVGEDVAVLHSASVGKAHYGGLMVCGSVWTCPPCAAKISERRKQEVVQATNLHKECGGALYMVTHTFSHQRGQDIGPMMVKLSKARAHMRSQRAYKDLKREMGYVGDIRALEVTYGDANGFHPHEHDLWLVASPLSREKVRRMSSVIFDLWKKACAVAGLGAPNRKRGVDVREMESAAEYVAKFGREPKWGVGSELAKQAVKTGKVQSLSPFDLLRKYQAGEARFGALFVAYAKAFFGKRQLIWSDGLRQLFGIQDLTDEEIAVQEAEDAKVVIRIKAGEWRLVLRQGVDARASILMLAETRGHDAVRLFLDELGPPF